MQWVYTQTHPHTNQTTGHLRGINTWGREREAKRGNIQVGRWLINWLDGGVEGQTVRLPSLGSSALCSSFQDLPLRPIQMQPSKKREQLIHYLFDPIEKTTQWQTISGISLWSLDIFGNQLHKAALKMGLVWNHWVMTSLLHTKDPVSWNIESLKPCLHGPSTHIHTAGDEEEEWPLYIFLKSEKEKKKISHLWHRFLTWSPNPLLMKSRRG